MNQQMIHLVKFIYTTYKKFISLLFVMNFRSFSYKPNKWFRQIQKPINNNEKKEEMIEMKMRGNIVKIK